MPDLLGDLSRTERTGILCVRRGGIAKSVHLDRGRVVFASTGDADERMGEMLVREGVLGWDQLEAAAASVGPGKRLGAALVGMGFLSPDRLIASVEAQVRSIVFGLFEWEEGEYTFEESPLPADEPILIDAPTAALVLDGIRRLRSVALVRRGAGSPRTQYRVTSQGRERLRGLLLTDGESVVLSTLEEGPRTVEQLCLDLFVSGFEIHQTLWAFRVLGVIEIEEGRSPWGRWPGREAERLEEEEFLAVLGRLCRDGETGLLHVSRGTIDRTFHLREGRCVFATSTNLDDGLLAHLFRRGMISLHDREEVSRRLLKNKRVGALLLEMGALDETDLAQAIREQVSAIVYDTARWEAGEHVFFPGELPTLEEVTLHGTVEDLVLQSVRQVHSWTRILRGVGGLDARLGVTPSYLDTLDRMSVGADEWDLVASLASPRTVREVCRSSTLGDYRVCQTLWALRMLGALTEVAAPSPCVVGSADVSPAGYTLGTPGADAPTADEAAPRAVRAPGSEAEHAESPRGALETAETLVEGPPSVMDEIRFEPPPERIASAAKPCEVVTERVDEPVECSADAPIALPLDPLPGLDRGPDARNVARPAPADTIPRLDSTAQLEAPARSAIMDELGLPARRPAEDFELAEPGVTDRAELFGSELSGSSEAAESLPSSVAESPGQDVGQKIPDLALASIGAGATGAEDPSPPDPALDRQIERFNTYQRIVYRVVRAEVGAGASNFVRFCALRLADGFHELFATTDLFDDGSWDPIALRDAIRARGVLDPWLAFQRLVDKEAEMVGVHLGIRQAEEIRRRIDELERAGAVP